MLKINFLKIVLMEFTESAVITFAAVLAEAMGAENQLSEDSINGVH